MMTNCTCTVTTCLHNHERCCCKSDILVEGHEATASDSTCCASFDKRSHEACSCTHETASPELRISCNAVKCKYNDDRKCIAKSVSITGCRAADSCQTECATFQMC